MTAIINSLSLTTNPPAQFSSGPALKPSQQCLGVVAPSNFSFNSNHIAKVQLSTSKKSLRVQASCRDGRNSNSGSIFIGGFVLGGLIVGSLGCVYAPQISEVLVGDKRKELMRKLPDFIYNEEKAVEKTRKKLADRIAELNSAIDGIAGQIDDSDDVQVSPYDAGYQ